MGLVQRKELLQVGEDYGDVDDIDDDSGDLAHLPRKRCMDLVSFETQQEYDWVKGFIDGGVQFFWTSGR